MKLIIDIPDNEYKQNKHYYDSVYHGIPLDDVKAKIDEQYDRVYPYNIDIAQGLEFALDILDNIGKAESEDKK